MERRRASNPTRATGSMALAELISKDPSATRSFLETVFDWKFETVRTPQGEYLSYNSPSGSSVGIRPTRPKELATSMNYILVADLAKAEKTIQSNGGKIILPRTDLPGMGSFFWFKAPGGPIMACWQDAPKAGGR